MMKLVEECSGRGELRQGTESLQNVPYRIRRYQGMSDGSGLPIPGLFRTEGSVDLSEMTAESTPWIDVSLVLKLEDGRALAVTITDSTGRVLSEGHGPSNC